MNYPAMAYMMISIKIWGIYMKSIAFTHGLQNRDFMQLRQERVLAVKPEKNSPSHRLRLSVISKNN